MPLLFKKKKKIQRFLWIAAYYHTYSQKVESHIEMKNLYQPEIPIFVVFIFTNFQKQSVIFGWRN